MRDWRGIRPEIGDRIFYVTADGARKPKLHEAWVEDVGETHIRVRPTASPFGEMIGNDHEVRWLHRPEDFGILPLAARHEPIARRGPGSTASRLSTRRGPRLFQCEDWEIPGFDPGTPPGTIQV